MVDGTYDVALDTPKHHKRGTLALKSAGERVVMQLKLTEIDPMEFTGTCADRAVDFEGAGEFPGLGAIDYKAHGDVWGNSIDMKCETTAGTVTIFGTRLSGSAGDLKSSHEYLMKASTAEFDRDDGTMFSGRFSDGG